ncbi:MAG: peptidoglycan/xylan/chitin deacetylase (PgdA/CDA1 family) [Bradymonadia bacterium]|jgi:peptidoglycan/xylan/chitin deacetylase (PgdA/CDA1 family)
MTTRILFTILISWACGCSGARAAADVPARFTEPLVEPPGELAVCAERGRAETPRRVAVTIDDLPWAGGVQGDSAEARLARLGDLCDTLRDRGVPATGFFNPANLQDEPALVELWRGCGLTFGNHTWSHPRLREIGVDAYLADLRRGHERVQEWAGDGAVVTFRYPYLSEGASPEERDAIRDALRELQSPIVPVTIDTWDWLYARGWSDAMGAGDEPAIARWIQAYRWNIEEATEQAEWLSDSLFGYEPPQILLLHANELNAVALGERLDWYSARGYEFISVAEALADPAYAEYDASISPTGDSHWLRLRRSRTLP